MKSGIFAAAAAAALLLAPQLARADQASRDLAISSAIHAQTVQNTLQQSLQTQLQQQQNTQAAQQQLLQFQLRSGINANLNALQNLTIEQRLLLIQAQMREYQAQGLRKAKTKSHPRP